MRSFLFSMVMFLTAALVFGGGARERAAPDEAAVRLTPAGAYPIVEEPVDMTYMLAANPFISSYEYGENWLTTVMQDRTNVRLTIRPISEADYAQRLNLMFATRADMPDMVSHRGMDANTAQYWGEQGALRSLDDSFLAQHSPNFLKAIEYNPAYDQLARSADGKIYGYSNLLVGESASCYHCNPAAALWMNTAFLETLGLDVPTTTEEFRSVLRAIRDGDPNRTGRQDTIPLVGARTGWVTDVTEVLLNAFVIWQPGRHGHYVDDGVLRPAFVEPGYRQGLAYMNSLVQEGLLDPVTFTQDGAQLNRLVQDDPPVVGFYPAGAPVHYDSNHRDDYTHLSPLRGPEGVQYSSQGGLQYAGVGNPGHGLITSAARHPEVAARWFDQFFDTSDLDFVIAVRYGQPGRDWRWLEPREVVVDSGQRRLEVEMLENVWSVTDPHSIHWFHSHPRLAVHGVESADWDAFDRVARMGARTTALLDYLPPDDTYVPPLRFFSDEVEEFQDLWATINTYITEARAHFVVGDLSVDNDWESYVRELRTMGLDRLTEIMQTAFDRAWK